MKRLVSSLAIGIGWALVAGSTLNLIVGIGQRAFAVDAGAASASQPASLDSDLDGLSDADEAVYGTNLLLADTDGDGISDGSEVAWGTDPLVPNSHPDLQANLVGEFDGVQNQVEAADSDALTPPDALTVPAWVQLAGDVDGVILTKGSYTFALVGGRPVFEVWFHGQARSLLAPGAIPDSAWHHVAGVCDGKALRIYLEAFDFWRHTNLADQVGAPSWLCKLARSFGLIRRLPVHNMGRPNTLGNRCVCSFSEYHEPRPVLTVDFFRKYIWPWRNFSVFSGIGI